MLLSPSLNSNASKLPVDAPDGTDALPTIPLSNMTSTSTVGFPLESNISLIEVTLLDTLEEAIKAAYNLSEEGDVILLSPACASWDQYKCFEDRGNEFKRVFEI